MTIVKFNDFLNEKGISEDDPCVPLLQEVWDQAITSASDWLTQVECRASSFETELLSSEPKTGA